MKKLLIALIIALGAMVLIGVGAGFLLYGMSALSNLLAFITSLVTYMLTATWDVAKITAVAVLALALAVDVVLLIKLIQKKKRFLGYLALLFIPLAALIGVAILVPYNGGPDSIFTTLLTRFTTGATLLDRLMALAILIAIALLVLILLAYALCVFIDLGLTPKPLKRIDQPTENVISAEAGQDVIAETPQEEVAAPVEEEAPADVRSAIRAELEAYSAAAQSIPTLEEIRSVLREELEKRPQPQPVPQPSPYYGPYPFAAPDHKCLTKEEVVAIVREELSKLGYVSRNEVKKMIEEAVIGLAVVKNEPVKPQSKPEPVVEVQPSPEPKPVVVEVKPEPKPEPIAEPKPAPVVVEVKPEPKPEPVVEIKKAATPVVEVKPVIVEEKEAVVEEGPALTESGKKVIIRIPFEERMQVASKELLDNYNELKNYILAFGVKSRISNSGDTFRLHTETYVKITIAGKGLKLYYALDPKTYADTTIPVGDVGHKGIYTEIPAVFKVKSPLSVKRAKLLVDDVMAKKGLVQGEVENVDYAKTFKK